MGNGLSIRGDSLYCPLSFSLDSYWMCLNDCLHCWIRRLNEIWGKELRPTDPMSFEKTLKNGLKYANPKTSIAMAIAKKKTLKFGNKTDPFQEIERELKISQALLQILESLKWSVVIQTMCTHIMMDYIDILGKMKEYCIIQPIISPGLDKDWELLERKRTTKPTDRIDTLIKLKKEGFNIAVNGEPFIPGYHTIKDFEDTIKLLKNSGINNYNTYNFHFNSFVARRLHVVGIDIQKIWEYNQDSKWKPMLQQLIDISKKHNVILGCPDFVNSGSYVEKTNTCCGVNVPNPCTYNIITWKNRILCGENPETVFLDTWDGIGNFEEGRKLFDGTDNKMYSLKDAGISISKPKKGLFI